MLATAIVLGILRITEVVLLDKFQKDLLLTAIVLDLLAVSTQALYMDMRLNPAHILKTAVILLVGTMILL